MSIQENILSLRSQIRAQALLWGREPESIRLVAVSKRQSIEKIQNALDAGQTVFGENRVQEAIEHWADLKPRYPDLELRLIGPLQTNKISQAIALFDVIETIDREKLARKLGTALREEEKKLPCFIQVNTGEEPQKAGISPKDFEAFLEFCQHECGLDIQGLMCIPPVDEPAALHFSLLKNMAVAHDLPHLSMGMSADYEQAIAAGATYIRIGTGIFGMREDL